MFVQNGTEEKLEAESMGMVTGLVSKKGKNRLGVLQKKGENMIDIDWLLWLFLIVMAFFVGFMLGKDDRL